MTRRDVRDDLLELILGFQVSQAIHVTEGIPENS